MQHTSDTVFSELPKGWMSFDEAYKWFEQGYWIRPKNKQRPGLYGYYYLRHGEIETYPPSVITLPPHINVVNCISYGAYSNPPPPVINPGEFNWHEIQLEWQVIDGHEILRKEKEEKEEAERKKAEELETAWLKTASEREKELYKFARSRVWNEPNFSPKIFYNCMYVVDINKNKDTDDNLKIGNGVTYNVKKPNWFKRLFMKKEN